MPKKGQQLFLCTLECTVLPIMLGAGETAQWLGALTALPQGPGLICRHPHGVLQLSIMAVPGDPVILSGLLRQQAHRW